MPIHSTCSVQRDCFNQFVQNKKTNEILKTEMKIAVMTAIFGGIDVRKTIPEQTMFFKEEFFDETNCDLNNDLMPNDRQRALFFKTMGHTMTDADIIIWVDGKIQITAPDFIEQCVDALGNNDIAIMKHLYRKCIYEEVDHIEHCIKHGNEYLTTRYAHRPIRKQVELYRAEGYPENNGLNDCCIIARRNNEMTNMIFDNWWQECQLEWFDQISIQYMAWRYGIKIHPIIFKSGSFVDTPHILLK